MSMTRREFLKSAAVAGAGVLAGRSLGFGGSNPLTNSKPNIIMIFPDEWRWDGIGALNLAPVQTPNVDRIAKNGVIFSNCYTCGPLCMPARASLMTGQYVHEHGQWNNQIPARAPGSASHVRRMADDAGYYTALIGKAHLYNFDPVTNESIKVQLKGKEILEKWGFKYSDEIPDAFGLTDDDSTSWAHWLGTEKYSQFQAYMHYYWPRYVGQEPWETPPLNVEPPPPHRPEYQGPYDLTWRDHYDTYVGERAASWIRDYHKSNPHQPFYLQVNFPGPHYPENSTTKFRDQFNIQNMGHGILQHPRDPAPLVQWSNICYCTITDMTLSQHRKLRQIYFANQLMIDHAIGRILHALHECGIDHNTWILFCSDHGEMLGDHYLMYKIVFYESSTKVPLIIRPPSYGAGWISNALTDHLDLTTTLLDLAGLSPMSANHGTSLLPKVKAGPHGVYAQTGKDQVVSEVAAPTGYCPNDCNKCDPFDNRQVNQLMLRTEKYKMNVQLKSPIDPVELYDLVNDPNELRNLINEPSYSRVHADMLSRIYDFYPQNLLVSSQVKKRHAHEAMRFL